MTAATAKKATTRKPAPKPAKPTAAKPGRGATVGEKGEIKKEATPAPKEKPEAPAPTTLIEALTTKQAVLVKIRGNGTVRSLPYLKPGTPDRLKAEAVAARVE